MIVRETKDIQEIESVIFHPSILPNIIDDDNLIIELPRSKAKYIGCYIKDKIVGVGMFHDVDGLTFSHMHMLKEFRKDYALEFGLKAIKESPTSEVYTNVDDTFQNIKEYVKKLGFKFEKKIKGGVKKHGLFYDVSIYKIIVGD